MSATLSASAGEEPFHGWRMVALAFLVQNFAIGLTFGSYGVSVLAIEQTFSTGRATASAALSLVIIAITGLAPFLGALYGRISIRKTMMVGAVLTALGYAALAVVDDWRLMLAAYGLLVGPGVACMGTLPTNVLIANWFASGQGRALGIVNMPLFVMLVPMVAVVLLEHVGLRGLYAVLAVANLFVLPAMWVLVDRPEQVGQKPRGASVESAADNQHSLTTRHILGRPDFWFLIVAVGIVVGGGTMKLSHMVPLLAEQGHPVEEASFLLALSGGAGMFGSLIFGWLADRFGGAIVLAGNAIIQSLMWFIFLMPVSIPLLVVDALIIGMCGGGVMAAQGVFFSHRFGVANFGRVAGLVSIASLPILAGLSPVAGYLRERTGGYNVPVMLLIVASIMAAAILIYLALGERQRRLRAAVI
jgi:MFS family permease